MSTSHAKMDEKRQFYMLRQFRLIRLDAEDSEAPSNWLGRIVTDHSNPEQFVHHNKATIIESNQYTRKPYNDTKFKVKSTISSKPHAEAVLVQYEHQSTQTSTAEFAPLAVEYFRVKDDEALRQQLLGDPEISEQLRKLLKIGGRPIWVIVGFLAHANRTTTASTKGVETGTIEVSTTVNVNIPASAVLAASGVGPVLPPELDPGMGREVRRLHELEVEYSIDWPCIFAIEYRSLSRVFRVGRFKMAVGSGPQGSRTFDGRQPADNTTEPGNNDDMSKELIWGEEPISEVLQDQGSRQLIVQELGEISFVSEKL